MIVFSDNTATNLVLDAIGIGATAATMEKMGYPNTKIHSKVFRRDTSVFPERSKQFGLGSTTARRDGPALRGRLSQADPEPRGLRRDARAPARLRRPGQVPPAPAAGDQGRLQDRQPGRHPDRRRDHRVARRTRRRLRHELRERGQALGPRQRRQPPLCRDRPGGLRPLRSHPPRREGQEPKTDRPEQPRPWYRAASFRFIVKSLRRRALRLALRGRRTPASNGPRPAAPRPGRPDTRGRS